METEFFHSGIFTYVILPLLIFLARILDVTIGTLRIIFISKGKKSVAPLLGFFEVLIWVFVIGWIMQNLNNLICYVAYAAGFAMGNYIGLKVEEKLAIGFEVIRIITQKEAGPLIEALRTEGYGTTSVEAKGHMGDVHVIFTIIKRSDIRQVVQKIRNFNPAAFFTVEDVRMAHSGTFPLQDRRKRMFRFLRYGK